MVRPQPLSPADKGDASVRVDQIFHRTQRHCPRVLSLTVARHSETAALSEWLDDLPHAESLCVHICLKGMLCDGAETVNALGGLRKVTIHSCVEEKGGSANGHEGVCAFRFLLDNYHQPWGHVYFLHGDMHRPKHSLQYAALKRYLDKKEWPLWPRTRSAITADICGCQTAAWPYPPPFGPRDFWYASITWWLGNFLQLADRTANEASERWAAHAECSHGGCSRSGLASYMLHNGTWNFPLGFMFVVDRASALQRSREWIAAQYRMCRLGVRALPPGMHHAARAAVLRKPGFDYAPLPWAHVNERLPYALFGHEYVERPVPRCVLVGDHADQNCSYNHHDIKRAASAGAPSAQRAREHVGHHPARVSGTESVREHERDQQHTAAAVTHSLHDNDVPKPAVRHGCKPRDENCGSTG